MNCDQKRQNAKTVYRDIIKSYAEDSREER